VASSDKKEAEWIAARVETYFCRGLCEYSDIGILLRSVSTSAPPFIDVFRDKWHFIIGVAWGCSEKTKARA